MKKTESVGFYLFQNLLLMISQNYAVNDHQLLNQFQKGVKHYKDFVFLQDMLIDNDVDWLSQYDSKENILTEINSHYKKSLVTLLKVFPENHLFWEYLEKEEKFYCDFIAEEKYNNIIRPSLTLSDFEAMSYAKHNLALVPVKGMSWLFEEKISYEDIKTIFVLILNGMQMMDDIDDFEKDLKSGQWNLIQSEVQNIISEEKLINDGALDRFEERVFYASGLCDKYTLYALDQYKKAINLTDTINFKELKVWLSQIIVEIQNSLEIVKKVNS